MGIHYPQYLTVAGLSDHRATNGSCFTTAGYPRTLPHGFIPISLNRQLWSSIMMSGEGEGKRAPPVISYDFRRFPVLTGKS